MQFVGVVMRERILSNKQQTVPVKALEGLLRERIGWIDEAISPFARAARDAFLNPDRVVPLRARVAPYRMEKELRLAS